MPNMPLHTSRPTNNSNQMLQKYPQMPGIAIIVVNYKQYCVYGEDAMRTTCPICQAERGCNETMVLCWLLSKTFRHEQSMEAVQDLQKGCWTLA